MLHIPKKRKNSPLVGHSFYAPLPAIKTRTARYLSPTSVCLDSFSLLTARTGILHAKTFLIAVLCNIIRRSFPHVRNKPFSLLEVIKWHFDHEIWNKAVHVYNPCFTNISVGIIIIGTNLIVFIWIFMMRVYFHTKYNGRGGNWIFVDYTEPDLQELWKSALQWYVWYLWRRKIQLSQPPRRPDIFMLRLNWKT